MHLSTRWIGLGAERKSGRRVARLAVGARRWASLLFSGRLPFLMSRPHRRPVLECASPLALWKSWVVESAGGPAHSKTLPRFILNQCGTVGQGFKTRNLFRGILTRVLSPSAGERENRSAPQKFCS